MAFRSRFKSLLGRLEASKEDSKEDEHSHHAHGDGSQAQSQSLSSDPAVSKGHLEEIREFADDPTPDAEIIKGIQEIYYNDSSFDVADHELKFLPEKIILDDLEGYRDHLRRQQHAVSRQLSQMILDNQGLYVRELERVIDLQASLQKANSICMKGRRHLHLSKEEAALRALNLLTKQRRKLLLLKLMKSLRFIKTLQQTDVRLKELLEECDYATAIQLCLECQTAAYTLRQYNCISELSSNLQETLDQIEEQLDVALSKVCNDFDKKKYQKIQSAYSLLGKTQIAMDQLQMHYLHTLNNISLQVVSDFLLENNIHLEANHDLSFPSLCKSVGGEHFTACLVHLCKNFWKVMSSYNEAVRWHKQNDAFADSSDDSETEKSPNTSFTDDKSDNNVKAMFDRQYVKTKLEQGLTRIWQDIQQKVKTYILSTDLAYFKYDDFIFVLDIINRLIQIGEEFCGSKSQTLQESIRVQTVNYFKAYHRSTLDELRMFLENEAWELCPVQANFGVLNLQEFHFLKPQLILKKGHRRTHSGNIKPELGFFETFNGAKSPFDSSSTYHEKDESETNQEKVIPQADRSYYDDNEFDDEDDVPDELKMDYIDEGTGEDMQERKPTKTSKDLSQKTRIVTNTTLNVLRSFGKYMQMMTILKPIAFDVVICMSQLFDYYLYSVYTFFGSDNFTDIDPSNNTELSDKMRMTLKRISNNIILKQDINPGQSDLKVFAPSLSAMVELNNPEELFGLTHRMIAMESLVFLAKQLMFIHANLDSLIPIAKRAFLAQFFTQTVEVTDELRVPVYKAVAERTIDLDQTIHLMGSVKWDIKDIMSQHSSYVDVLLKEFQVFSTKLNNVSKCVPVPKEASDVLWTHIIQFSSKTFVEGFASVKKCSNEGRALMQLDYQQFLMKLETITQLRPIPGREFVEAYIKAFYLSENDLDRWLKDHTEYSIKQLNHLVTCGVGSHISKKAKSRLLGVLEDMEKSQTK